MSLLRFVRYYRTSSYEMYWCVDLIAYNGACSKSNVPVVHRDWTKKLYFSQNMSHNGNGSHEAQIKSCVSYLDSGLIVTPRGRNPEYSSQAWVEDANLTEVNLSQNWNLLAEPHDPSSTLAELRLCQVLFWAYHFFGLRFPTSTYECTVLSNFLIIDYTTQLENNNDKKWSFHVERSHICSSRSEDGEHFFACRQNVAWESCEQEHISLDFGQSLFETVFHMQLCSKVDLWTCCTTGVTRQPLSVVLKNAKATSLMHVWNNTFASINFIVTFIC